MSSIAIVLAFLALIIGCIYLGRGIIEKYKTDPEHQKSEVFALSGYMMYTFALALFAVLLFYLSETDVSNAQPVLAGLFTTLLIVTGIVSTIVLLLLFAALGFAIMRIVRGGQKKPN